MCFMVKQEEAKPSSSLEQQIKERANNYAVDDSVYMLEREMQKRKQYASDFNADQRQVEIQEDLRTGNYSGAKRMGIGRKSLLG